MWKKRFQHSRERTLLLLVPPERFARQEEFVYEKLSAISVLDWRAEFLQTVKTGHKHLNLSVRGEVERLKEASAARPGQTLCVINTEYALTRFSYDERQEFWRALWGDFPYNESILIYSALDAPALLPLHLERWKAAGRVLPPA
jgi:hypothetical protein